MAAELPTEATVIPGPTRVAGCEALTAVPVAYAGSKRVLDFLGALALLLVLFPLFVVLAILVKLTSPGPAFFRSTRVGLCGVTFPFIKFRTMYADAEDRLADLQAQNEKDGPIFKIKKDPRTTPIGKFLRRTSLDELPQLWSVLTGQMSLVGPRPPLPREVLEYDDLSRERLRVKPGITCYWQISGRSNLSFAEWMELDRKYIQEMSFFTDLSILLRTPLAVIRGDGAY